MGKLLVALGISEEKQNSASKSILDAERLIIGMQTVYSNTPESKKKDLLADAISESIKLLLLSLEGKTIPKKEEPKKENKENKSDDKLSVKEEFKGANFIKKFLEDYPEDSDTYRVTVLLINEKYKPHWIGDYIGVTDKKIDFILKSIVKISVDGKYDNKFTNSDYSLNELVKWAGEYANKFFEIKKEGQQDNKEPKKQEPKEEKKKDSPKKQEEPKKEAPKKEPKPKKEKKPKSAPKGSKKDDSVVKTSDTDEEYGELTQEELKERKDYIYEAMEEFDKSDIEYKELELQIKEINLYIE